MSSIRGAFDTFKSNNLILDVDQQYTNNGLLLLCGIAIIFIGFLLGVAFSNIRSKNITETINDIKGYLWRKRLQFCNKRTIKAKQSPFPSPMRLPMTHMDANRFANKMANKIEERTATVTNHRVRKESISYQPLNVNDEYRITLYAVLEETPIIKV